MITFFHLLNKEKHLTIKFNDKKFCLDKNAINKNISKIVEELHKDMHIQILKENRIMDHNTGETLSNEEMLDLYSYLLPNNYLNELLCKDKINQLTQEISKTKLHFIETQRLIQFDVKIYNGYIRPHENKIKNHKLETVTEYSNELAKIIQEKHKEYWHVSESS